MKKIVEKIESFMELGGTKKDIALLIISGAALLFSLFGPKTAVDAAWVAIILCGVPIILEAIIGLVTAFDIKADVLVSIALIASVGIGEDFAAGEVAFIMQIGGLLEEHTVARARAGIEKLVHLTPQTARRIVNGREEMIPAENVQIGDILRVLPGESIAADGVITSGETSVDQAVMTGEPLPVDKTVGDEVSSGTVNQFGAFEMRATRVGEDSSIRRMIRLVQSADAGKAKIVGIADRWATWIVVIALTASILTGLISGEIIRAVTILVVFCPCALVLATPAAIMAAIGNAAKHGFLVREGDALERLVAADIIAFDKTGTLTHGSPRVTDVHSVSGIGERELFEMAGGVICAGSEKLMAERGIEIPADAREQAGQALKNGSTVIYIAGGRLLGYIVLSDTLRSESREMVRALTELGISPVLLTGDSAPAAKSISAQLGIGEVKAGCLPEDKLSYIKEKQAQSRSVCMIGDGVNDAPALKAANVGIAMGGVGSDIAVDAADIALVDDEVKELPHLFALSKRMMRTIKFNLSFSMGLNFLAIILAITGVLGPVAGALVHNGGSVFVVINSALLLKWRKK